MSFENFLLSETSKKNTIYISKLYKKYNKKIYYNSSLFMNEYCEYIIHCIQNSKNDHFNKMINEIDDFKYVSSDIFSFIKPIYTFNTKKFYKNLRKLLVKQKIVNKDIINWNIFFKNIHEFLDTFLEEINKFPLEPDFDNIFDQISDLAFDIFYQLYPVFKNTNDTFIDYKVDLIIKEIYNNIII